MSNGFARLGAVGTLPGLLLAGAAPLAIAWAAPLAAQEVVQQLPNPAAAQLSDAMRRLSRNPSSRDALVDAARASLELDDAGAADGFLTRASAVAPNDGTVMALRAQVALRQGDPALALALFEQAGAAGERLDPYGGDHGLAFDLTGQNAPALERYGAALARAETDEVVRRMALSYAISGDQEASEATLLPLLQRRDVTAYRTRAFSLAVLGREDEAVAIAEAMLPPRMALRLTPYLRNMRSLTSAQQAAAGNLGQFPAAAQIGRDEPRLTRRADIPSRGVPASQADARLIPGGRPLGSASVVATAAPAPAEVPSPALPDEAEVVAVFGPDEAELPAIAAASPPPSPPPPPPSPVVVAVAPPPPPPPPSPTVPPPVVSPPVVVAILDQPTSLPSPPPAPPPTLAQAFAEFTLPPTRAVTPARPGAVDITAIEVARERPPPPPPPPRAPPPPPPPPRHPSRIWVQVGTGQDVAAFRFDWRRMVRTGGSLMTGHEAYRARWGQTNRLLTGPFDSVAAANRFVTQLEEKGIDAFRFTSAAGEEVVELN